jgi:Mrp family chromosome partitioning ATPase
MPQGEAERVCDELLGKLGQGCLVLAVTSEPARREVKSSVAAQLAVGVAAARARRVLLLEGDMSRPRVHRSIEAEMATSTGFTQQLQAKIQAGVSRQWSVLACSRTLHVLAEGRFRSPEMLRSPQFAEALSELRERYDLIVIDGPTIDAPSDMRVLRREADTVVIAVGSEAERASAIEQGTTLFGASLLTVAANP